MNIPSNLHQSLKSTCAEFIHDNSWNIPIEILDRFPDIRSDLAQTEIPLFNAHDHLIWQGSSGRELAFKDAFNHFHPAQPSCSWINLIWSNVIPPSKSFVTWRLIHSRLPTQDQLLKRSCTVVTIYSLCILLANSGVGSVLQLMCR